MTSLQARAAPSVRSRRAGSVVGAIIDGAMLWLIHGWPGWEVAPVLTVETPRVLGIVTASLVAGIGVNLLQLLPHPGWLTPAGSAVTSAFGVAVLLRVLQVFPFAFHSGFDWALVVRVVLVVGIVGAAVGLLVAIVSLLRLLAAERAGAGPRTS